MKTQKLAAMLLTVALSFGASQAALAHECTNALDTLTATIGGAYFANDSDSGKLQSKVTAADLKLNGHKPYGAIQKLGDISTKINRLLSNLRTQKIDPDDGADILGDVTIAQDCIAMNIDSF